MKIDEIYCLSDTLILQWNPTMVEQEVGKVYQSE